MINLLVSLRRETSREKMKPRKRPKKKKKRKRLMLHQRRKRSQRRRLKKSNLTQASTLKTERTSSNINVTKVSILTLTSFPALIELTISGTPLKRERLNMASSWKTRLLPLLVE
jgi:hypothetical protein